MSSSVTFPDGNLLGQGVSFRSFGIGTDFTISLPLLVDFSPAGELHEISVNVSADDGSALGAYASLFSPVSEVDLSGLGVSSELFLQIDMSSAFFEAHVGTSIKLEVVVSEINPVTKVLDAQGGFDWLFLLEPNGKKPFDDPTLIQNDYFGITRLQLSSADAATEIQAIVDKATTERIFVDGLLSQVQNTTIPAVAVEGSMYGAVGTSDEITLLATSFLPAQVQNAITNDLNPQVYACEALGLAFAFADENKGTAFADKFGPTATGMSPTPSDDAFFAIAAATAIFGSDANANTPGAIRQFVSNWEAFYTSHGIPGVPSATPDQIVIAARGAAWGDAVGVALANHLGPLSGQVINFLEDAAREGALYTKALASQPAHEPFQGGVAEFITSSASAEPVGLAAADHLII